MSMFGYHGRVLHVDLTSQRSELLPLGEDVLRCFIGGVGLAAHLLYEHAPKGVDPFAPENALIFAAAPFTDTPLPGSNRFAVAAKSPLTGFIGTSLCSGEFAVALKRCGVDALIITGKAPTLTWLLIEEGKVQFYSARQLTGLSPADTEARVKQEVGGAAVAAIGRAGEEQVRFAAMVCGGRYAGRTGIGAVMGGKNLKAIAVRGKLCTPLFDFARLEEAAMLLEKELKYQRATLSRLHQLQEISALPSYNFREPTFQKAYFLYEAITERLGRGRLEYETLWALGPNCGIADAGAIFDGERLCDVFGLDSISAGVTIAWAMECFERGVLTAEDTDGIELRFGEGEAMLQMIVRITRRQGLGDILADGVNRAAQHVGQGSEGWAMHVKGLEMPGYDPRTLKTLALALAVAPEGAHHNRSSAYDFDFDQQKAAGKEIANLVIEAEDMAAVLDSLILNKQLRHVFEDFYAEAARLLRLVTGWDVTADELRQTGERIHTLKKLFNIREGWQRRDDALPPRIVQGGPSAQELDAMIAAYYRARGWTEDGLICG